MGKSNSNSSGKAARDNRANQLNENNDAFHQSRGLPGVPSESPHGGTSEGASRETTPPAAPTPPAKQSE
jgi:hypothetical protein